MLKSPSLDETEKEVGYELVYDDGAGQEVDAYPTLEEARHCLSRWVEGFLEGMSEYNVTVTVLYSDEDHWRARVTNNETKAKHEHSLLIQNGTD